MADATGYKNITPAGVFCWHKVWCVVSAKDNAVVILSALLRKNGNNAAKID
ncbi:hypothetical protein [Cyclobacterium qasimii]|uniref:Uncharacterized protein n=1 Tax=Cyclobacterium qasimii M12-11B TaxID=641524 RepID=S7WVD6_9BACT|nr:hypothetical protein [Cyclobacterium qasimii]EPR68043.1 hypothetical protein ADICYQ_3115 [Cyclobacterium qasimii M12-11B]